MPSRSMRPKAWKRLSEVDSGESRITRFREPSGR